MKKPPRKTFLQKNKIVGTAAVVFFLALGLWSFVQYKFGPYQSTSNFNFLGLHPHFSQNKNLVAKAAEPGIVHNVGIPILMYHHVGNWPADSTDRLRLDLTVSPENFDEQVAWLKAQGYHSVSLTDLYKYSQGEGTLPEKPIAFTFDDGYDDVFTYAVPILEKYGYSGSFGIITQWPGTVSGTNTYASWATIQQAAKSGMEIVCHTQNHFDGSNPKFDSNYIFNNLTGCKKDMENNGISTNILIYPYGHTNPAYIDQAKNAGFVMGLVEAGKFYDKYDDIMRVPRIRVGGSETLDKFEKTLLGLP